MKRVPAIDIARGLVMIIMALDHTRDYLHIHAAQSPTDLTTTTPVLFFTRWITHLCAPSFVFLSGLSAWLYLHGSFGTEGGPSVGGRRSFLWKRGLVLLAIEFTVVNFALFFDLRFRVFLFQVIAATGSGMILLSVLSRLNPKIILTIAIILFAGHDAIAFVKMPSNPILGFFGSLLFRRGAFPLGSGRLFVIAYPVLPWLSIMLLGFCTGPVFTRPAATQRKFLTRTGLAAFALFIVLRYINVYGDPAPWTSQTNAVYTFLSFMNLSKYPPSLLFGLATLSILLLILAAATKEPSAPPRESTLSRILWIYGRVPLFYFIVHLYLIHVVMLVMASLQGHPWSEFDFGPFKFGRPEGAGLSLEVVYVVWAAVVITLYPLCRWYGRYKATHKENAWLRYL